MSTSTKTMPAMPVGLKAILDINLDFITYNKQPLTKPDDNLTDDDGKTLEPVYTSGPIKTLIEGHLHTDFLSTPIINFDVTFFTWNFSLGGASQDSLYNTFGWEKKQKLIEFLVDVQLLNGVAPPLLNEYQKNKYDIDSSSQQTLYEKHLSVKLSYEAKILRSNVLSWIYERMMNDYQAEIDAWNGWFDQYPAGFDFGISLINSIKNLATPSSSSRALIKVGGKTTMMTTSSEGGEDGVDMNEYRLDMMPFLNPTDKKWYKRSIDCTMESIEELKKSEVVDMIASSRKFNTSSIKAYCTGLTEEFNKKFMEIYKKQLESDKDLWKIVEHIYKKNEQERTSAMSPAGYVDAFDTFYNYRYTILESSYKVILIHECTDSVVRAELLEGLENKNLEVINIKLNLPKKVRDGFIYDKGLADRLSFQIVIDTSNNKWNVIEIIRTLEKIFTPYFEMNKTLWQSFTLDNIKSFLGNNLPDFLETSKLFLEWRRSQIFYGLDTVKGDFERLADVTKTVPGIMQRTMSYLNSGHYFDAATNVRSIGPTFITLSGTPARDSVILTWNAFPGADKYYVFKDGKADPLPVETLTKTISSLSASKPYSFYINAVDASGTVLEQSQTIMVTPEQE